MTSEYIADRNDIASEIAANGQPVTYVHRVGNIDMQYEVTRDINAIITQYRMQNEEGKTITTRDLEMIIPVILPEIPTAGDYVLIAGVRHNVVNVNDVAAPDDTLLLHKIQLRSHGGE